MSGSDNDPFSTGAGLNLLSEISAEFETALVGRELDGYRIGGFIAEGGMSRVYRASRIDGSFERDVAIKLSPVSGVSAAMRERFIQEQSVLAGLNHPHIAQLYDARITSEGWPYIVMELVDGSPITDYCSEHSLTLESRLRLLIDVIDAVAFTHGNLVVHRDIKPSNVLVTVAGDAKLLDFGIAKLLEGDAQGLTQAQAMTPKYASPEQLLGQPIGIASDVYQLGLMIAEVLSDTPANDGETLTEAIRRCAEGRAIVLPTTTRDRLPPEIGAIVEQCLRVDPLDRYRDANSLRNDLAAYLSGHPVSAVGQTSGYRFRKFLRRNRGSVLGASLTFLALATATIVTGTQMMEAERQRDRALYQQQRIQASNEFYSLMLEEMGDGAMTSVELLDRGRALLENQFGNSQPFMSSILLEVSRRYGSLGERQREAELLEQAQRIARAHDDTNVLAAILCRSARNNLAQNPELAEDQFNESMTLYQSSLVLELDTKVECLRARSRWEGTAGNSDAALAALLEAQALFDANPSTGSNLRGMVLNDLAFYYYREGELNEAIVYLEEVLDLLQKSGRGTTLGYQRVASNRAVTLQTLGRTPEALAAFSDLIARMEESGFEGRGSASLRAQYGDLLMSVGRVAEAETVFSKGLAVAETNRDGRTGAYLSMGLAKVHLARKDFQPAFESLNAAEAFIQDNTQADPQLARNIRALRVKVLRVSGNLDAAATEIDALLATTGYPEERETPGMISALIEAAEVYRLRREYGLAEQLSDGLIERLEEHMRPAAGGSLFLGRALVQRAEIRLDADDSDGAISDLEAALPHLDHALGEDHRESEQARALLGNLRQARSVDGI